MNDAAALRYTENESAARNDDFGSEPLLVSQTGRWVMPKQVRELQTDSRGGWNARAALGRQLHIRNEQQLSQVWAAVTRAAVEGKGGAVMTKSGVGEQTLLTVRPARENGFAVISVQRVDAPPPPPPFEVLAGLFQFTPTECEIAVSLLNGQELSDIATGRQTSLETVRGHVKNLLRKTGLNSQKQFTAMMSRLSMMAVDASVTATR
ncbi:MAG: helix-turn-helix transcriptional regulator [Steroidobacteraceae bacterium]